MFDQNPVSPVPEYAPEAPAEYKQSPTDDQIRNGVVPLDSLPAQWWNAMWGQITEQERNTASAINHMMTELVNVLKEADITPSAASDSQLNLAITTLIGQTKDAIEGIIGSLSDLTTSAKNTVVAAINALDAGSSKHYAKGTDTTIDTGRKANSTVGSYSTAEGMDTIASGEYSHAEGAYTTASGKSSHAEGNDTTASGVQSHAEGTGTTANGTYTHAEGFSTTASGESSHAEGMGTTATGNDSHAEGSSTKASSAHQHVQGKYNIEDTANKYAHIVGNGTADNARSNAHTVDWSGNSWYKGDVMGGGTSMDAPAHKLSGKLNVAGDNATAAGMSTAINKLSTSSTAIADSEYLVSTESASDTTQKRKPFSKLWEYIKGKIQATALTMTNVQLLFKDYRYSGGMIVWADSEGGSFRQVSANGLRYAECDMYDNNWRIYFVDQDSSTAGLKGIISYDIPNAVFKINGNEALTTASVQQTYDSASALPVSGVGLAEALATIPLYLSSSSMNAVDSLIAFIASTEKKYGMVDSIYCSSSTDYDTPDDGMYQVFWIIGGGPIHSGYGTVFARRIATRSGSGGWYPANFGDIKLRNVIYRGTSPYIMWSGNWRTISSS